MTKTLRIFHVSEESDISRFLPRTPKRKDLDQSIPLVWAIEENKLVNFLTPRDCPRVCFHRTPNASEEDLALFSDPNSQSCIAIEQKWFRVMKSTPLYLYEFDPRNFVLQDACAGYYVSKKAETPISVSKVPDLFEALFERNAEVRVLSDLWAFSERVKNTKLDWSLCRMKNALRYS